MESEKDDSGAQDVQKHDDKAIDSNRIHAKNAKRRS